MSSEQDGQLVVFMCDNCDEEYEVQSHDFAAAWELAKEKGWRCFKNKKEEWEHRCPECRGK